MKKFNIAVIPGDGIGKEVMPEAIKILELIKTKFNLYMDHKEFDWGCHHYEKKVLVGLVKWDLPMQR